MSDQKKQRSVFLESEADSWYLRNKQAVQANKTLAFRYYNEIIKNFSHTPKRVLEIGCSSGYSLGDIHSEFGCEVYGLDPSAKAIAEGNKQSFLNLTVGTADSLPYSDKFFDLIIYGFCLYLCDPDLLFKIAYEGDRVLSASGHIIVLDFKPPFNYRNIYHHKEGLFSYKMDFASMFLWHPAYSLVSCSSFSHSGNVFHDNPDERLAVSVLAKLPVEQNLPTNPFN